ncbi:unnamed protein product [Staurois parvus]|uniref:Uncharacterized protein n=1 Tax=Staurois parvus TaxID=386267 RepID=A0ABN9EF69_9NEOB|nr:unnamed protein product [Staurois parvus]
MTAGTGSDIGSSRLDSGHGSPGIRSFGLNSEAPCHLARQGHQGHQARPWALSQLARQQAPSHQVPDCLARQQASGHQASMSFGSPAGTPRHLARQVGTESPGTTSGL